MKKATLFFLATIAIGGVALAQSVVFTHRQPVQAEHIDLKRSESPTADAGSGEKTTTGNTKRWYSYFETMDTFVANGALHDNMLSVPIWQDSTVRQRFSTGMGTINYSSIYQIIAPAEFLFYNRESTYPGAMEIYSINPYSVDSIFIAAVYQRLPARANVVDTLVLSVSHTFNVVNLNSYDYLKISSVDSIRRTAYVGTGSSNPGAVWKVPLYYGDSALNGKFYRFRVGGPAGTALQVPAGRAVAITATFKTGDTWVRNVDSFNQHNNWRPITANTGPNIHMPYQWNMYADRNMSGLMFSNDSSEYFPSVVIEGLNTNQFSYEFHYMGMKAGCANCQNVGIADQQLAQTGMPYPNPANAQIQLPFRLRENGLVQLDVLDLSGRLLIRQDLGRQSACDEHIVSIKTEGLAAGSYLYLLRTGGGKNSGIFRIQR